MKTKSLLEKNKIKSIFVEYARKIIKKILFIVIVILIVYNILYMLNNVFGKKKYIQIFDLYISTEKENSMSPIVKHNSLLIGSKSNSINVNDIVSYENGEMIIYHRIIRINNNNGNNTYITKADKNYNPDIEEKENYQIKSKLIINIPAVGFFFRIFESKITTVLIIIGLLLRFFYNNYKIKMSIKRRKEKHIK